MYKIVLLSYTLICISTNLHSQNLNTKTDSLKDQQVEVDNRIFTKVESEAQFPGGMAAWVRYLQSTLKASVPMKNGAPMGKYQVIIKFIVSKDGSITHATAETNHGYGMEAEVIRIITGGPKWIPATQNGRKVNAYRRQPVTFVVSN